MVYHKADGVFSLPDQNVTHILDDYVAPIQILSHSTRFGGMQEELDR